MIICFILLFQMEPVQSAPDLGETFDINVRVINQGDSTIPRGQLLISLPGRTMEQSYYIYVGDQLMRGSGDMDVVSCSGEGVDPDNFEFNRRRARRRSR